MKSFSFRQKNKQGMDCTVIIRREKNRVMMETNNLGISIFSATTIKDDTDRFYIALTGDQCALTDIHITRHA